jgi:hypothetical protein
MEQYGLKGRLEKVQHFFSACRKTEKRRGEGEKGRKREREKERKREREKDVTY